jgi:hypothetical protein
VAARGTLSCCQEVPVRLLDTGPASQSAVHMVAIAQRREIKSTRSGRAAASALYPAQYDENELRAFEPSGTYWRAGPIADAPVVGVS